MISSDREGHKETFKQLLKFPGWDQADDLHLPPVPGDGQWPG